MDVNDFLQVRCLDEPKERLRARSRNLSPMGICFSSDYEWRRNQVLLIEYFLRDDMESVKLKVAVRWSEFIDSERGYFCGGAIYEIERGKEDMFINYYFQQLKDKSP